MKRSNFGFVLVAAAAFSLASAVPVSAAKITLQIWDWYQDRFDVLKPKIQEYMKLHPNIEIKTSMVAWDAYPSKVLASVIGGNPPDIIEFHNSWTGYLLKVLSPFPPELFQSSRMADEYYQFNTAFRMKDGKFYFFPDGLMSSTMFYNKTLWAQAGLASTPKTWDDLRLAAKKLTKTGAQGRITQPGFEFSVQYLFDDINYQFGGGLYNDKHTNVDWYSDEGRKAIELVGAMTIKDRIKSIAKDTAATFESGKVGIFNAWTWQKGTYLKVPASKLQWGTFPTPTPSGSDTAIRGRNNYECGYAVPANLKGTKRTEAFKFLKWLYSDDKYYIKLNDILGRLPGKKSLWTRSEIANDVVQASMIKTIPYTVFPGERPNWIDTILGQLETNIVQQKLSPLEALKKAQDEGTRQWKIQPPKWIVEKRLPK